ncbi:hypothetical protein CHELA1G2_11640 [Hyphomicrobiales bacterium]|nr:hypothetical protein CHELA1G2_11640 [Hyphomicrobiales bacterium]
MLFPPATWAQGYSCTRNRSAWQAEIRAFFLFFADRSKSMPRNSIEAAKAHGFPKIRAKIAVSALRSP